MKSKKYEVKKSSTMSLELSNLQGKLFQMFFKQNDNKVNNDVQALAEKEVSYE